MQSCLNVLFSYREVNTVFLKVIYLSKGKVNVKIVLLVHGIKVQ